MSHILGKRARPDLSDAARSAAITFDFVNKTIKYKAASSKDPNGRERYYILNATDKEPVMAANASRHRRRLE